MTRNRLLALALVLLVGGGVTAYVRFFMRPPERARALPREGGDRPYTQVVEGPGHEEHMGGLEPVACKDCHIIRAERFLKPDGPRCLKCHERTPSTLHASAASRRLDECTGCHQFLMKRGQTGDAWNCQRCHAERQGKIAPVQTHGRERCRVCHRPHEERPTVAADCVVCHEHERLHRARHGKKVGSQSCLDCHTAHGQADSAIGRCVGCHVSPPAASATVAASTPDGGAVPDRDGGAADVPSRTATPAPGTDAPRVPASALFARGHDACTDCHSARSHDFRGAAAAGCRGCHTNRNVLGEANARQHGACSSCHASHNARATAKGACARCHSQVRPAHPLTEGGRCLGCHPIHPAGAAPTALACSSCHREAGSETGFHTGGTRCVQCHRPHQFAGLTGATCRGCHTNQAAQTLGNVGHQNCTRCHQAHRAGTAPPACATCHEPQARTRPRGHRFECERCHEQHSGRQKGSCLGCHADRTQMLHGTVQGGCTTCHRAHGPSGRSVTPACTSCHARGSLPNLHAVEEHGQCRACHVAGHGPPRATRGVCLVCHEDQRQHEPQAALCSGCHTFGVSQ